jgi:hypothetical protein
MAARRSKIGKVWWLSGDADQQRLRDEKFEGFERDSSCQADQERLTPIPKAGESIAPAQATHTE